MPGDFADKEDLPKEANTLFQTCLRNDLTCAPLVRTLDDVAKTDRINFRLGPQLRDTLRAYTDRYDRSEADVIREALWMFLESKGFKPKQKGVKRKR